MKAGVGTRVVVLEGTFRTAGPAGVVIAERLEAYLKRFVVRCDNGRVCFASANDLALESDPTRAPLGPPIHE